jgi:glycolate oxidase iron-sulfur subunit
MMQIAMGAKERGLQIAVMHPVQLLDDAYRAGGTYTLTAQDTNTEKNQQRTLLLGIGIGLLIGVILFRRRKH